MSELDAQPPRIVLVPLGRSNFSPWEVYKENWLEEKEDRCAYIALPFKPANAKGSTHYLVESYYERGMPSYDSSITTKTLLKIININCENCTKEQAKERALRECERFARQDARKRAKDSGLVAVEFDSDKKFVRRISE